RMAPRRRPAPRARAARAVSPRPAQTVARRPRAHLRLPARRQLRGLLRHRAHRPARRRYCTAPPELPEFSSAARARYRGIASFQPCRDTLMNNKTRDINETEMSKGISRRNFLRAAGAAGVLAGTSMLPPSIRRALAIPAAGQTGTLQDIKYVVI